jgi:hypothetical protein
VNLVAWGPSAITVITMIFTAGLLVGNQRDMGKALGNHAKRLDGHDLGLQAAAIAIAKLEAWRDGYNAATYKSHEPQFSEQK